MELCLFFNDILKMGLYDSSLDRKKLFPEPFTFKIVSREPEICCTHPCTVCQHVMTCKIYHLQSSVLQPLFYFRPRNRVIPHYRVNRFC